ncbi:MAG: diguanylate cyclase [Lachnospiraceae bacterium]|nr:diguanylate cyclase [Lachnospiraceae bacterium]
MKKKNENRLPIRRRVIMIVMQTILIALLAACITGIFCIRWIRKSSESVLKEQFESNIKSTIEQKAVSADARLEHYEKYIEFVTDYIGGMYKNEEKMIERGRIFNSPIDSKEYFLTRGFTREDMDPEDFRDELLFFSNLEEIWAPIAKANEDLITTVYLGTKSGMLVSYDRWSYLSVPPEGKELVYDFYQSGWYTQGLKEDGVFYTGLYVDSQGRGFTITVASPFRNADGEFMGVDCADFDITGLYEELLSLDLGEGTFSFALDHTGTIISADQEEKTVEEYTGLTEEELLALRNAPDGIMEKEDAVYVCVPIERVGWTLCVSVPISVIQASVDKADRAILYAVIAFVCVVLILMLLAAFTVNRVALNITYPMELLGKDMKIISDGNLDYRATVYRNDEIGDITSQMNKMVDRLNTTMKELLSSQQYADAMSELATRDALTGVYNKTAFNEKLASLEKGLADGNQEFALVMIDLNNLKQINDSCGHDKGDISIRKVCQLISGIFLDSPVYRIGGDEFVVVLEGEEYQMITELIRQFKSRIHKVSSNMRLEPWERVSAAIGYALYDEEIDSGADSVLVRADREMYRHKRSMKRNGQ